MELTYTKCGDYLIPDLVLLDTKEYHIGKYGRLRRAYLKEHRPILYTDLIVTEKLFPHLEEIDTPGGAPGPATTSSCRATPTMMPTSGPPSRTAACPKPLPASPPPA